MLLHHPAPHDSDAYTAMENAVKAGKIRSIGLSNYYEKEIAAIMKNATIPPAVVQNETHPYNQWRALKPTLARYGTVLETWYPLGGRNRYGKGGTQTLFKDPVIAALAENTAKPRHKSSCAGTSRTATSPSPARATRNTSKKTSTSSTSA
nr:aldo/keto reductase [uncultured Cardiobacterium sp.]